jgi:hypothetical protein
MEVRGAGDRRPVVLSPSSRKLISETLKPKAVAQPDGQNTKMEVSFVGVLRALDLDKDWLEITIEGQHQRIKGLSDTVDDVIGPMVNHQVIVRALRDKNGVLSFVDIEQEE